MTKKRDSATSDDGDDASPGPAKLGGFSLGQRLGMLVLNTTAFVLAAGVLCITALPWCRLPWRLLAGAAVLYGLPPVLARLILAVSPIRQGVIMQGSADFFKWWGVFNLQVLFCRLPMLEELVRIVPGAYSAWLRLWGARVGRLTYWAAGTSILDRSFVVIGDDVILGAGVRINPHVMRRNADGAVELLLADVAIGDRAIVGGYSLLTTGTTIAPDETTRAFLQSPPFSHWRGGRRVADERGPS